LILSYGKPGFYNGWLDRCGMRWIQIDPKTKRISSLKGIQYWYICGM